MGGIAAIAPIFQAIAPLASTLLSGGGPQAPSPAPAPAAPAVAPPPQAPEVQTVDTTRAETPAVDTEAARVRASKRRKAAEDAKLFSLSEDDSNAVVLSKSLLGE